MLIEVTHFPMQECANQTTLPVFCHGQCPNEWDKENREMFHELRNSLSGIVLGLSNIESHWAQMTLSDFMRSVQQIKEIAHLMGDVMNKYNLPGSDGQGLQSPEELDVTTIVARAVKNYSAQAAAKHILLTFHPLVLCTIILGDRVSILQIIENLISNAIRFSPMYSAVDVFVAVSSTSAAAPHISEQWEIPMEGQIAIRFVRVEIHGSGLGISLIDKDHPIKQDVHLSAHQGGKEKLLDLDLSIIKQLTDTSGGQLWYESYPKEERQGSKFVVEFPLFKEM